MRHLGVTLKGCISTVLWTALLLSSGVQASDTTSAIRGKIIDSSGSSIANARVVVIDLRTNAERTYTANESGTFYAARLPVGGPYKVTVNGERSVTVQEIKLGDIYALNISMRDRALEEVIVYGDSSALVDVAAGPSAAFSSYDLETAVSFDRDITQVYSIDPRINLDQDGFSVNCAGKHPRFNSVTLDGVSQNDRFGLNSNGYSTATGMPFPYDAIEQVSVELAPFDVTYGGFSACNINSVTKTGSNEFKGGVFYEYTSDRLRGESIDGRPDITSPAYKENKLGFHVGGPILEDKLFFFAAYEESDEPRFIGQGYNGSGNGIERPWLSQSDFDRISNIAQDVYNYNPGGQPGDGVQENEKYMVRLDWQINDDHSAALIYNYFDGFQDRASDSDSNEFEFANHFYVKGAESETVTLKLNSQWTDALSTEVFYSMNEMKDSQVTKGPGDFGDFQISLGRNTVYLGADDSRQANALNTESDYFRVVGHYLIGDHVVTAGYEREELSIFNQFVQHARGGEYDFFDDAGSNPAACDALTAQGRLDDATCALSGIDKFELGRPSRIYYGSGGGSNNPADASASFSNTLHSLFIQDEWFLADNDLTLVFGVRYDTFKSDDQPTFNPAFTAANGGLRNDANIDGLDIVMPRLGFTWEGIDDLSVRGGLGLYSGGNPNVWISNAWSNDGLTNVQLQLPNFDGADSVLDGSILLNGNQPGRSVPQSLFDQVAATTSANASTRGVVLLDPGYKQPGEWKLALGATYGLPWYEIQLDVDLLHSKSVDSAYYVDLSQTVVGTTILGQPVYDFTNGQDNYMLTNSSRDSTSNTFSLVLNKDFDFGLDLMVGYAYTDAEDLSPMTSSVAGSNFDNVATSDVNNLTPATSNYVVPHRFTLRASYATELLEGYQSRVTVYGYASEGQPQSYVMGSGDLEGDGFFGRHLLYVPTGPTDPNVVFDPGFDSAAFFAFTGREGLGAGFQARNENHAKWSYRMDLRVDQELPTFIGDIKGKMFLKIYNLSNLLNDDWGQANDAEFFSVQVVESSLDAQGRYVFEEFNGGSINDLNENQSLWEARLGIEFTF